MREHEGLKFTETKTLDGLLKEIFSDNYKVLEKGLKFEPGDVILDLGANEGVFSLFMAKHFPKTRIIAVEPVHRTFLTLLDNLAFNDFDNIEPWQFGVGSRAYEAEMIVSKDFSGGSTTLCEYVAEDHEKVGVHIVTLQDLAVMAGFDKVKLMKVDIEGMEYEALYAAEMFLERVENVVLEVHMNRNLEFKGVRADGLVTWLDDRVNLVHVEVCRMTD